LPAPINESHSGSCWHGRKGDIIVQGARRGKEGAKDSRVSVKELIKLWGSWELTSPALCRTRIKERDRWARAKNDPVIVLLREKHCRKTKDSEVQAKKRRTSRWKNISP